MNETTEAKPRLQPDGSKCTHSTLHEIKLLVDSYDPATGTVTGQFFENATAGSGRVDAGGHPDFANACPLDQDEPFYNLVIGGPLTGKLDPASKTADAT